jgi:hypothetical protein
LLPDCSFGELTLQVIAVTWKGKDSPYASSLVSVSKFTIHFGPNFFLCLAGRRKIREEPTCLCLLRRISSENEGAGVSHLCGYKKSEELGWVR